MVTSLCRPLLDCDFRDLARAFLLPKKENMIRKANNQDIKIIYSLLLEEVSNGKILKRSVKELKKVIKSFFVYEISSKIVGCCSLEVYCQKLAEIRSLIVSCEYRNRGIGSALVKRCLDEAKRKKVYQVLSVTDKSNFFERFGFKNEVSKKQAVFLNLDSKG